MPHSDRDSEVWLKVQNLIDTFAGFLSTITLIAFVLCLGYLCYLGYNLLTWAPGVGDANVAKAIENLQVAGAWMQACGFICALVLVLRQKSETQELYGFITLVGLSLWFGAPFAIRFMTVGSAPREALEVLAASSARAGQLISAVMLIPMMAYLWRSVTMKPLKRESDAYEKASKLGRGGADSAKPRGRPNLFSPCWHLPYCRDYLLDVCPAFKAKRRCWKFGGGCFCDQRMIESMMRGLARRERGREEGYMRAEIDARTGVLSYRSKKPPCHRCFIYLEHEKLKFDVLSPLMHVLAIVLTFLAYERLLKPGWMEFQLFLARSWQRLAFREVTVSIEELQEVAGLEVAGLIFAVVIGMLLLLGLLKLAELWCFKWKL